MPAFRDAAESEYTLVSDFRIDSVFFYLTTCQASSHGENLRRRDVCAVRGSAALCRMRDGASVQDRSIGFRQIQHAREALPAALAASARGQTLHSLPSSQELLPARAVLRAYLSDPGPTRPLPSNCNDDSPCGLLLARASILHIPRSP